MQHYPYLYDLLWQDYKDSQKITQADAVVEVGLMKCCMKRSSMFLVTLASGDCNHFQVNSALESMANLKSEQSTDS